MFETPNWTELDVQEKKTDEVPTWTLSDVRREDIVRDKTWHYHDVREDDEFEAIRPCAPGDGCSGPVYCIVDWRQGNRNIYIPDVILERVRERFGIGYYDGHMEVDDYLPELDSRVGKRHLKYAINNNLPLPTTVRRIKFFYQK